MPISQKLSLGCSTGRRYSHLKLACWRHLGRRSRGQPWLSSYLTTNVTWQTIWLSLLDAFIRRDPKKNLLTQIISRILFPQNCEQNKIIVLSHKALGYLYLYLFIIIYIYIYYYIYLYIFIFIIIYNQITSYQLCFLYLDEAVSMFELPRWC